jgi:UDPglucose 6-dehydrogenase
MRDLYRPFTEAADGNPAGVGMRRNVPYLETGIEEAQIIKYASNAFLATRISFVNELASICEHLGADVLEVTNGLGLDPRIGNAYLSPGIGFGGPCLEKDLKALTFSSAIHGYRAGFLEAALRRNDEQVNHVVNKVIALCGGSVTRKRIAALGLAFKAGTNDVRTSVSIRIIDRLLNLGAAVAMHDPVATGEASTLLPQAEAAPSIQAAVTRADCLLLLTDWPEYMRLDWFEIAKALQGKIVFDGRNALDWREVVQAGLAYHGIGRPRTLFPVG